MILEAKLRDLKKRTGRSWITLRLACLHLLGREAKLDPHEVIRLHPPDHLTEQTMSHQYLISAPSTGER
jgi:hypothetical protein